MTITSEPVERPNNVIYHAEVLLDVIRSEGLSAAILVYRGFRLEEYRLHLQQISDEYVSLMKDTTPTYIGGVKGNLGYPHIQALLHETELLVAANGLCFYYSYDFGSIEIHDVFQLLLVLAAHPNYV